MNLTLPQIRSMMTGMEEILKIQEKTVEKKKYDDEIKISKDSKKPQVNDLSSLLGALGGSVKMTKKAKKKFIEMSNKNKNKKES